MDVYLCLYVWVYGSSKAQIRGTSLYHLFEWFFSKDGKKIWKAHLILYGCVPIYLSLRVL